MVSVARPEDVEYARGWKAHSSGDARDESKSELWLKGWDDALRSSEEDERLDQQAEGMHYEAPE